MGATATMPAKKRAKKDEKEASIPTKIYEAAQILCRFTAN